VSPPTQELLRAIRLVALDIDGVLSDGTIAIDSAGLERRVFDIKDGLGIVQMVQAGLSVAVISSSSSQAGVARLERLGIQPVLTGVPDKWVALQELMATQGLSASEVAFMGDDLPDLPCLEKVGLPTAPANAVWQVVDAAHWVSAHPGGRGAVRELSDLLVMAASEAE
jgi:3-deoxy-D-manno-octulosonate 8-phosphate phosphatase (KDO 8-P phosphatase)